MSKLMRFSLVGICLVFMALAVGGCGQESPAKANAVGLLRGLYDCPDEELLGGLEDTLTLEAAEKKFAPYLAEGYKEKFVAKYAVAFHGLCSEAGGTSKLEKADVSVEGEKIAVTASVLCTDKAGKESTVMLKLNMSADEQGKISFFNLPANARDYYSAIGAPQAE